MVDKLRSGRPVTASSSKMVTGLKFSLGSLRTFVKSDLGLSSFKTKASSFPFSTNSSKETSKKQKISKRYDTVRLEKVVIDKKLCTIEEALNRQNDRIVTVSLFYP